MKKGRPEEEYPRHAVGIRGSGTTFKVLFVARRSFEDSFGSSFTGQFACR